MSQVSNLDSLLQHNSKSSIVEKKLLLRKISEMKNLPTPSANMMKVMLLLRDEDVKIDALVEAIEKDQSMVAQILKLINSGFYGLRKSVETVEHAIALLGIINIKQVVYSASIMEFFSDDEHLEWNHSYSSSVLMGNFIKENELPGINILPLAMLMHDLGKVVLRRFSPKKYQVALQHAANDKLPIFMIEDAMLQINHAEVGSVLLQKWDSSEDIVKPVLQHHMKEIPEDFIFETALVQFINWADCTCRSIPCYEPTRELMDAAGIDEIDKNYWLDKHSKLIESLEKSPALQRDLTYETKTLEKKQAQSHPVHSHAAQQPAERHPAPAPATAENDTADIISIPKGGHDTAPAAKEVESQKQPPQIVTRIGGSMLSGKELAFMKKTYNQPTEITLPPPSQTPSAVESVESRPEGEGIPQTLENTPVSVDLPMQMFRRNQPTVNIQPMPQPPEEETPLLHDEPGFSGVQRPTQVISRRTGIPVSTPSYPPPEPEPASAAQEVKTSTAPISKEALHNAPPKKEAVDSTPISKWKPAKKGFFARIIDWIKKNS